MSEIRRFDYFDGLDPNDTHFMIARMSAPSDFVSGDVMVEYSVGDKVRTGSGSVTAGAGNIAAQITYDDPWRPGEKTRNFDSGSPGKLIPPERLGSLHGVAVDGRPWRALGAIVTWQGLDDPTRPSVRFHLDSITVDNIPTDKDVAYTREVFLGPRLPFLTTCLWTPVSQHAARADRIEERAFNRRITLRDLQSGKELEHNAIAVVYDGLPVKNGFEHALWLAASVLAGTALQPVVVETYNQTGTLIERTYRPGSSVGAPGQQPFHMYYAPYESGTFGALCNGIKSRLDENFPVDVIIAHIHDANDGAMERRMQSYLLAIHTASEAWNRLFERTIIIDKEVWGWLKRWVAAAARGVADAYDLELGDSVCGSVFNANNTSTSARLRLFLSRVRLKYEGPDKKSIELRNKLFHDGYLQRRFLTLTGKEQQERYDQLQRLRDFSLRMMFSVVKINGRIHSALNPLQSLPIRDD